MNIQQLDLSVNLMRSLLWQYNDAEKLQALIQAKQDWFNENNNKFWSDWVRDVFDVRTANEFGLKVWSIILNVPIIIQATEPAPGDIPFGFNEETDSNFEHSNFRRDGFTPQVLSADQARQVIILRYFQLTSNGTLTSINRALDYLYGDMGGAYVVDNYDMTITYIFRFPISSGLAYIFNNYDILPRPHGVRIDAINIVSAAPFGFDEFNNNFDNGTFER